MTVQSLFNANCFLLLMRFICTLYVYQEERDIRVEGVIVKNPLADKVIMLWAYNIICGCGGGIQLYLLL